MGKGSKRRPMRVSESEFERNWNYIFRNSSQVVETQAQITGTIEATRKGAEAVDNNGIQEGPVRQS